MANANILEQKKALVAELAERMKNAQGGVIVNYQGIPVADDTKLRSELRAAGVSAEIYPENRKMGKQMEYANRRSIPYVVIIGGNELAEGKATVKNMVDGTQESVEFSRLAEVLA